MVRSFIKELESVLIVSSSPSQTNYLFFTKFKVNCCFYGILFAWFITYMKQQTLYHVGHSARRVASFPSRPSNEISFLWRAAPRKGSNETPLLLNQANSLKTLYFAGLYLFTYCILLFSLLSLSCLLYWKKKEKKKCWFTFVHRVSHGSQTHRRVAPFPSWAKKVISFTLLSIAIFLSFLLGTTAHDKHYCIVSQAPLSLSLSKYSMASSLGISFIAVG